MQDLSHNPSKPDVLRRQIVPVPTSDHPELPVLDLDEYPMPSIRLSRRRSVRWLFIRCTSLTAAAAQLQGWRGDDHRCMAMRQCCRAYLHGNGIKRGELNRSEGPYTGVAMLSPEGVVVAAYFGPGDLRNTPIAADDYARAMLTPTRERLVPLNKNAERDMVQGLLPLAARTDRPRGE